MMTAAPSFMLRTVTSAGAMNAYLPDFSTIEMSPIYSDAGTVTFEYPQKGVNWSVLKENQEIAVVMNGVEILELRCIIETIEGDDADSNEEGAIWKYTCRTLFGALDYTVVYPDDWLITVPFGKWFVAFYDEWTPGGMMIDLFQKAQARGAMPGFTWDFSATHDSNGNAWPVNLSIQHDAGKKYTDILKDLTNGGWAEFRFNGRTIQAFVYGQMGVDRTIGPNPLRFIKGRDIKQAPRKIDTRDLITAALLGSSNKAFVEIANAPAEALYGRREGHYASSNTVYKAAPPGTSALELEGYAWLNTLDAPRVEVTHQLHFETADNPRPVTNFDIGDWGYSDVGNGLERFRILQWVITVAADGTTDGSITMGHLFNTQLSQVNSALNAVTNGSVGAGSAPKNDFVPPATPATPIVSTANYFVNNIPRSNLTVTWGAITTDAKGRPETDLDHYQVRWQYTSDGTFWQRTQRIEAADPQQAIYDNLTPGLGVNVQVQAVDVWGNASAWSPKAAIVLAGDTIAPQKPAPPTLTSNVGTLRMIWSGLDYTGAAQPGDLAGVEVHLSTADFTPSSATHVDTLPPGVVATTITQGLTFGTQYWVKLVAVDTTGNRSTPSDTTSTTHCVLNAVVGTEIGSGQVGLGQIAFSDVGNLVDDGSFELASSRANRAAYLDPNMIFDATTASNGNWSLKLTGAAGSTAMTFRVQGGLPVKPGERVFGACDYSLSSSVPSGAYASVAISWLDKSGNQLNSSGAISPGTTYPLSDSTTTAKDGAWHARVTGAGNSQVAPPNVVAFDIWIFGITLTAGTINVDAVEIRRQIDTALIQNAAITNALIANLAVNDAKISDLSVGKLTVGTLSADVTVSARIKTADTGVRVELNSGGIGAWNSGGVQTVAISSADGSVSIVGQLKSGLSGQRVEINPTATLLPEIRFYPTSGSNYAFINSFAGGSGSIPYMGVNSGQFTMNSTTEAWRLYMTDTYLGLECVRASDQVRLGNYMNFANTSGTIAYTDTTRDFGHIYWGSTSAEIGFNSGSDTADNWMTFNSDGTYNWVGRFANYAAANHNAAQFSGVVGWSSNSGVIMSYGPTMVTTPNPLMNLYYTGSASIAWWCNSRSTTSFAITCTVSNTAAAASINATCLFNNFRT